jgi:serine/threonine protein kinase
LEKLEKCFFKFNEVFYWDLIFEMLCGVQFIHDCRYVHLDIKPSNFLIDINGCVKIGDFGLTKKVLFIKNSQDLYEGDSSFLAPEFFEESRMINSNKNITQKCDVFSLGLSILELLCRIELPPNGTLWKKIRSLNFIIPEEFFNNCNIKIPGKMIKLMSDMLIISPILRPSILSILQNTYYEEINYRYNKLIHGKYSRCIETSQYFKYDTSDNFSYTKKSDSFKLIG